MTNPTRRNFLATALAAMAVPFLPRAVEAKVDPKRNRQMAKAMNFGVIYGDGGRSLINECTFANDHVIAGEANTGKTTVLRAIAKGWIDKDPNNRVLFLDPERSVANLVFSRDYDPRIQVMQTFYGPIFDLVVDQRIQNLQMYDGNVLIIMDMIELAMPQGLTVDEGRQMASDWARDLSRRTGCPVIRTKQLPTFTLRVIYTRQ